MSVPPIFLVANRWAYKSFFSSDDLDNIANARTADVWYYARMLFSPGEPSHSVFRPVAAFYYFVMARAAGLNFPPYVAVIQLIHMTNLALLWFLARAFGASRVGACGAVLLFAFHAAMMDIYWRPMYVFDLVCASFILLTLLTYVRGHLVASLICFWLALKSKEVALFLPVAILAIEWIFGKRNWKRAAPFFAISVLFGVLALFENTGRDDAYTLRFTPSAVWTGVQFYASQLTLAPFWLGFAAALALVAARGRIVAVGLITFLALMGVLLVLPGRLAGAYLYCGFIGLAIAISACARPVFLAAFFALWIPWNYLQYRVARATEIQEARERAAWFAPVARFVRAHPDTDTYIFQGRPESMAVFGISGALKSLRPPDARTEVVEAESPDRAAALARPHSAMLVWAGDNAGVRILPREPGRAYLELNYDTSPWQLGDGWLGKDFSFRWIAPHASARLPRPAGARDFELSAFVPDVFLEKTPRFRVAVALDGKPVGTAVFDQAKPQTFRFALPPGEAGAEDPVQVTFDVSPPTQDGSRTLGLPIVSFGFR